jgi:hypothetical protein
MISARINNDIILSIRLSQDYKNAGNIYGISLLLNWKRLANQKNQTVEIQF